MYNSHYDYGFIDLCSRKLCTYYTKVKDGDATMAVLKTWDNSVITPIYESFFLHADLGTRDFCLFESKW